MKTIEYSSYASQIHAYKVHFCSLKKYYENPNYCKYCGQIIEVGESQTVAEVRKKKYHNKICYGKSKETGYSETHKLSRINSDRELKKEYDREWRKNRREQWILENGPCKNCGTLENLEVHHKDPTKKISHNVWSWSEKRRIAELAKCIVLCEKCHLQETIKQISRPIQHGTHKGYNRGCRCDSCRKGHRESMRQYRQKAKNPSKME